MWGDVFPSLTLDKIPIINARQKGKRLTGVRQAQPCALALGAPPCKGRPCPRPARGLHSGWVSSAPAQGPPPAVTCRVMKANTFSCSQLGWQVCCPQNLYSRDNTGLQFSQWGVRTCLGTSRVTAGRGAALRLRAEMLSALLRPYLSQDSGLVSPSAPGAAVAHGAWVPERRRGQASSALTL